MPVYDRRYRGYSGERRSPRGLFWTLARFGLTEVFSKRLLLVLFIIACLPVVVFATLIYLANNLDLLQVLGIQWTPDDELERTLSGTFFFWLMVVQANLAFLFASFAGPSMVGPDLAHGAMPLYLSRPMRRGDYMLGKLAILGTLLSASPGCRACCWSCCRPRSRAATGSWPTARIPIGILLGSLLWIVFLSLRRRSRSRRGSAGARSPPARCSCCSFWAAPSARPSTRSLDTRWGTLLVFGDQMRIIWVDLFAVDNILGRFTGGDELPVVACWLAIAGLRRPRRPASPPQDPRARGGVVERALAPKRRGERGP